MKPCSEGLRGRITPGHPPVCTGERSLRPFWAFPLVDGTFRGAGGNRTPVHQPVNEPATTIPDIEADAASPAGRLVITRDGWPPTPGLSLESAVFPAVSGLSHRHPPLLLPGCGGVAPCGIAAHDVCQLPDQIRRRQRTALGWQFLLVPRFTSLSNSGRMPAQRH